MEFRDKEKRCVNLSFCSFRTGSFIIILTLCIVLLSGCSFWWSGSQSQTKMANHSPTVKTYSLPKDASGTVIVQSGSSLWLLHAGSTQPIQILGGQYISISPDGSLLLEDGQQFISTQTGKSVGTVRAALPGAGLQESLWLSPHQIVLGSYEAAGLYTAGLTSTSAQVLSSQCSLGVYSSQSVNVGSEALLCLADSSTIGIVYYANSPARFVPITLHPSVQPSVVYISYPIWSPDGKHIIFVWSTAVGSNPPSKSAIVMSNLDGTGFTTLASGSSGVFCTLPAWSPDGKQLVYVQETTAQNTSSKGTFAIHLLTPATHQDQVLSTGTGIGPSNLVWSPDGHYVAYDNIVNANQPGAITLVRVSNKQSYTLTTGTTLVGWAA